MPVLVRGLFGPFMSIDTNRGKLSLAAFSSRHAYRHVSRHSCFIGLASVTIAGAHPSCVQTKTGLGRQGQLNALEKLAANRNPITRL